MKVRSIVFSVEKIACLIALASVAFAAGMYVSTSDDLDFSIAFSFYACLLCFPIMLIGKILYWKRSARDTNRLLAGLILAGSWWVFALAVMALRADMPVLALVIALVFTAMILAVIKLLVSPAGLVVTDTGLEEMA